MLPYLILVAAFIALAIAFLYVPLHPGIEDRMKLYLIEFSMRVFGDHIGDLIEAFFGPVWRNQYARFWMSLPFYVPFPKDSNVEFSWTALGGVPVRLMRPADPAKRTRAALIYIHGGGWSTMRPQCYDHSLTYFINKLGYTIFALDYRLAPEAPYPAAVDDCVAATRDLFEGDKLSLYGIDRDRVAAVGDSAGGNLSTVLARRLKDEKYIKCQVLIYPATSVFSFALPSYREYYETYPGSALLSPPSMARWILFYLGADASPANVQKLIDSEHVPKGVSSQLDDLLVAAGKKKNGKQPACSGKVDEKLSELFAKRGLDPDVSPLHASETDMASLPPTMVITAGVDVLRDEGQLYAQRLKAAKVDVTEAHYPSGFHGILTMPKSRVRKAMQRDIVNFLQRQL